MPALGSDRNRTLLANRVERHIDRGFTSREPLPKPCLGGGFSLDYCTFSISRDAETGFTLNIIRHHVPMRGTPVDRLLEALDRFGIGHKLPQFWRVALNASRPS